MLVGDPSARSLCPRWEPVRIWDVGGGNAASDVALVQRADPDRQEVHGEQGECLEDLD